MSAQTPEDVLDHELIDTDGQCCAADLLDALSTAGYAVEPATLRAENARLREALAVFHAADKLRRNNWNPWREWCALGPRLDAEFAAFESALAAKAPGHG